jgi:hypothetical protein
MIVLQQRSKPKRQGVLEKYPYSGSANNHHQIGPATKFPLHQQRRNT